MHTTGSSSAGVWLSQSTWANLGRDDEDEAGAAGVREPREPIQPLDSSGAALELPRPAEIVCSGEVTP